MNVIYKASARAKKLRITVKPDSKVLVTYPKKLGQAEANKFLNKHQDWVEKQLEKLAEKETAAFVCYHFGWEIKTRLTTFRVLPGTEKNPYLIRQAGFFSLYIHKDSDISTSDWQSLIDAQFEEQLKLDAKKHLIARTWELAKEKNVTISKVSVRKAKTRWGSCSSDDNISLSIYCMKLPDALIDYIICHELAHVKVKNHSKAYWNHLEKILPGAGLLDKEMRKYKTQML